MLVLVNGRPPVAYLLLGIALCGLGFVLWAIATSRYDMPVYPVALLSAILATLGWRYWRGEPPGRDDWW